MIIEIKTIGGELIYSGEHKNIKAAVFHCIQNRISLRAANLDGAELTYLDFQNVDLTGVSLKYSNLEGSSFEHADLKWAQLDGTNFKNCNLHGVNLECAYISENTNFNEAKCKPVFSKYPISYMDKDNQVYISIDGKVKTISDWDFWFYESSDTSIFIFHRNSEGFLRLKASYEAAKAYIAVLKNNNEKEKKSKIKEFLKKYIL